MANHQTPTALSKHIHDVLSLKKEFQLERLILFSDAVFAIAITLLVIEIKVPVLPEADTHAMKEALAEKIPEFFGFILSFAVIGQFWISHHRMFGYVTGYTNGLLWLNLLMLLCVVLVPFTSGLNSHYGGLDIVWMVYSLNMTMISLSLYFLYRYIGNAKRNISIIAHDAVIKKFSYRRNLLITLIFFCGFLFCIPHWTPTSWMARLVFFLIAPTMSVISKQLKKAQAKQALVNK